MASDYVLLRFQALLHRSFVVHWLIHVDVVFQASINTRSPFESNAWPVVRQCRPEGKSRPVA